MLTRLEEGLTDKRYTQLAHSLCTAHDMTYVGTSNALQVHDEDEVNIATDNNKTLKEKGTAATTERKQKV